MNDNTQTLNSPVDTLDGTVHIPLSQLYVGSRNVRQVKAHKVFDKQLVENIRIMGLLQNLVVVAGTDDRAGQYEVIVGGRRFKALATLNKSGELPDDYPVACQIQTEGSTAATSLTENLLRVAMHPADEFLAFKKMFDDGMEESAIASHFGVNVLHVRQRLKLAAVHKKIITSYKNGDITYEAVMAFTLSDTKTEQIDLFNELGAIRCHPHIIRKHLTKDGKRSDSRLAQFVTVTAYEKAGGHIVTDLFGDHVTLSDSELLLQLAQKKQDASAARLKKKEGWGDVQIIAYPDHFEPWDYRHIEAEPTGPEAGTLQSALKAVTDEIDTMENTEYDDTAEDDDGFEARYALLEDKASKLETKLDACREYTSETKATSIAFVSIGRTGRLQIDRGYVDPKSVAVTTTDGSSGTTDTKSSHVKMSQALIADLDRVRQQIVQATLTSNPAVASDLLIFTLAKQVIGQSRFSGSPLAVEFDPHVPGEDFEAGSSHALEVINRSRTRLITDWMNEKTEAAQWTAFRKLSPKRKQALIAHCIAECVCVGLAGKSSTLTEAVLSDLDVDYSSHWRPNTDNYFKRLKQSHLISLGRKLFGKAWANKHASLKKSALVELFHDFFNGKQSSDLSETDTAMRDSWMPDNFTVKK